MKNKTAAIVKDTQLPKPSHPWPEYTCRGRVFYDYTEALKYWTQHGGVLMEKLDAYTPAFVLKTASWGGL